MIKLENVVLASPEQMEFIIQGMRNSNDEPYDIDEEIAEAIIRSKFPNIDSAKDYIQSRLAEDNPMNFSVGKTVRNLIAEELAEDLKKQILGEDSK